MLTVDGAVFEMLFNHTIVRRHTMVSRALDSGQMKYEHFIDLSRRGEVPFPLFTASAAHVKKVISDYERVVFYGASKDNVSLATRGDIALADISLIIKDITRKQSFLKHRINNKNNVPGLLKKTTGSVAVRAKVLRDAIGYDYRTVWAHKTKEESFNYLLNLLADQNIYLSLYAYNQCPQHIDKSLSFSGIALNDRKCPYLFIKAGDEDSAIEPWGRRIFTASLLLTCLALGKNGPVSMDGRATELIPDMVYQITEEILTPEYAMRKEDHSSLDTIRAVATKYSLSPSAIVMRFYRLRLIDEATKNLYLSSLFDEFNLTIKDRGGGRSLGIEKAISRYNNPRLVQEVLSRLSTGAMSKRDARNLLYYKKGQKLDPLVLERYAR